MNGRPHAFTVYALLIHGHDRFRHVAGHADTEAEARALADAEVQGMCDVAYVVSVERATTPVYVARRPMYSSWAIDKPLPAPAEVIAFKSRRE